MDMGISYNTTLLKVNRTIDMLRTCGMDVTEFERARDIIDEEVRGKVKESYDYRDPKIFAGSGQEAFLVQDYGTALSKLNRLYGTLEKYDIYIKAYSFTKVIKDFISDNNKTEEEFNKHRDILIKLLSGLNHSGTLDYQVEEPIIKDVYHVVYLFIKEEFANLGESSTIKNLLGNEYLDYEVRRELENTDLKDKKYFQVARLVNQINSSGINATYADGKLIKLLVAANTSDELKQQNLRDLEIRLDDYLDKLTKLDKELHETGIENTHECFDKGEFLKSLALLPLNLAIIGGSLYGGDAGSRALVSYEEYLNTSKVYIETSREPVSVISEYRYNDTGKTTMYEYYPSIGWVSYDLSNFKNKDIEDYMQMDIEDSGIKAEIIEEGTDEYDLVSKYNEALRIIEEIDVDTEDTNEVTYPILRWILTVCFDTLILLAELSLYLVTGRYDLYPEDWPIVCEVIDIWEELDNLIIDKKNKKKNKAKVNKLTKEIVKLIKENKEVIRKIGALIPELEANPEFSEKVTKLKSQLETEDKIVKKRELGR